MSTNRPFKTSGVTLATLAAIAGLSASAAVASLTIPTVTIGNPRNAADTTTNGDYGAVAYRYNIGVTEVTNEQYAAFLNAVAVTDTFNLYNNNMASATGGITRSGSDGSYTYATVSGRANYPVNFVSFYDSIRFANWLHNGQPTGPQNTTTTEDGAYTLSIGPTLRRNENWLWAVTSRDEWHKAAYYQPANQGGDTDSYWLYPTSSNTITSAMANYANSAAMPVASYAPNFYGVYDMAGNVSEYGDTLLFTSGRARQGGSWGTSDTFLQSGTQFVGGATSENSTTGFRVVSFVCFADFNDDGFIDFTDFDAFVAAFEVGDSSSDFNADGFIDFTDFDAFVSVFETGC